MVAPRFESIISKVSTPKVQPIDVEAYLQPKRKNRIKHCRDACSCCVSSVKVVTALTVLALLGVTCWYAYTMYVGASKTMSSIFTPVSNILSYPLEGLTNCFHNPSFHECSKGFLPLPTYLVDKYLNVPDKPVGPTSDLEFFQSTSLNCGYVFDTQKYQDISNDLNCCYGGILISDGAISFQSVADCTWKGNLTEILDCPCLSLNTTLRPRRVKRF